MGRRNRRTPAESAEKREQNYRKALEEGRVGRPKKEGKSKPGAK